MDDSTAQNMKPPSSLALRNKIEVNLTPGGPPLLDIASMDSIGSCSIGPDYTADFDQSNKTNNTRPLSNISLRSVALSAGDQNSDDTYTNGTHVPSYVGISCAISGYSSYSRYSASARASLSRGSSPTVKVVAAGNPAAFAGATPVMKLLDKPVGVTPLANNGLELASTPRDGETNCETLGSAKSLVQQRIESLYGSEAAVGWRESRSKLKTPIANSTSSGKEKHRSPSCPPQRLATCPPFDASKKNAPVFRHIEKTFLERLEHKEDTEDLPCVPVASLVVQPVKVDNKSLPTLVEERAAVVNQVRAQKVETKVIKAAEISAATSIQSVPVKDGHWFLQELESVCDSIRQRVAVTESYVQTDGDQMSEEVAGIVRAAVGSANLLLTQKSKLSQFRQLCLRNINNTLEDGFETKLEDLEGFWAMVSPQVDDIYRTLDDISSLKKNNWETRSQEPPPKVQPKKETRSPRKLSSNTPKGSPTKTTSGATRSTCSDENQTELTATAAAKEALRKSRLKEAKQKAAAVKLAAESAAIGEVDNNEVTIFVAPNKPNKEHVGGNS